MKRIIIYIILVFITFNTHAQKHWLSSYTFSSGGGKMANGEYNITSTVGESFIQNVKESSFSISGGFQQNYLEKKNILKKEQHNHVELEATFYPNPASDFVNIKMQQEINSNIIIDVIDMVGKKLNSIEIEKELTNQTINLDLRNLPYDAYFLVNIRSINGDYSKTIKLARITGH